MIHPKDEALLILSDLMVRFLFTAEALQERGERRERIDRMLAMHDKQVERLRDLIIAM